MVVLDSTKRLAMTERMVLSATVLDSRDAPTAGSGAGIGEGCEIDVVLVCDLAGEWGDEDAFA